MSWHARRPATPVSLEEIPTWPEFALEGGLSVVSEEATPYTADNAVACKVSLYRGDITLLDVDAIVNAANHSLLGGGGVDGAIHRAAGYELYTTCRALHGCETGNAKITPGFKLPAQHVIHTVGPMDGDATMLASCYQRSLDVAKDNQCTSIAFPCISTGVYGYDNYEAALVALTTIRLWLEAGDNADHISRIIFCVFLEVDDRIYKHCIPYYFPVDVHQPLVPDDAITTTTALNTIDTTETSDIVAITTLDATAVPDQDDARTCTTVLNFTTINPDDATTTPAYQLPDDATTTPAYQLPDVATTAPAAGDVDSVAVAVPIHTIGESDVGASGNEACIVDSGDIDVGNSVCKVEGTDHDSVSSDSDDYFSLPPSTQASTILPMDSDHLLENDVTSLPNDMVPPDVAAGSPYTANNSTINSSDGVHQTSAVDASNEQYYTPTEHLSDHVLDNASHVHTGWTTLHAAHRYSIQTDGIPAQARVENNDDSAGSAQ